MEPDQPLSVDTFTSVPDTPLSINPAESAPLLPDPVVQSRTSKAVAGLGGDYGDTYNMISAGKELDYRRSAAAHQDVANFVKQQQLVSQMIQKQGPMSQDEQNFVQGKFDIAKFMGQQPPLDPNSVIEEYYAGQYLRPMTNVTDQFTGGSFMNDAIHATPQYVQDNNDVATSLKSYREFAVTLSQNLDADIQSQGTLPWLADQAKLLIQPLTEYKIRGNIGGFFEGGLLGGNEAAQRQELFRLPFNEYKQKLTDIVGYLRKDNPTLAAQYIQRVIGTSTADATLDDAFSVLGLSDAASLAKYGIKSAVMAAQVQMGFRTALKQADVGVNSGKALANLVEGKPPGTVEPITPADVKIAGAKAAGDLETAGAEKAAQDASLNLQGTANPTQQAIEALPTVLRSDMTNIEANPGRFAETVNRIKEQTDNFINNLLDVLSTSSRVNRTPAALADPENIKLVQEAMKGNYRGAPNSILDIGPIRHNIISNTYDADLFFAQEKGAMHATEDEARNSAHFMGYTDAVQKQQGAGWYNVMPVSLRENDTVIRNMLLSTKDATSPNTWFKSVGSWVRTPDETLALENNINRKIATYTTSRFKQIALAEGKNIRDLIKTFGQRKFSYDIYEGAPSGFKTSMGSTYELKGIGEGQTTVRTKAARDLPGHEGDFGVKPESAKTVYLTKDQADVLAPTKGNWRLIDHGDGTMSLATPNPKTGYGIAPSARNIAYSTTPEVGKVPLELFSPGTTNNVKSFRNAHFGNTISEVTRTKTGAQVLSKRARYDQWKRLVENARYTIDPESKKPGYFYKSPADLDDAYLRIFNRSPDPAEVEAYFSYVRLNEMDRTMRNLRVYTNKSRVGTMSHRIFTFGSDGSKIYSDFFDGVEHKHLPGGIDNQVIIKDLQGEEKVYHYGQMSPQLKSYYTKEIEGGRMKVVEVYDPESRPLRSFGDNIKNARVRYVVTPNLETKALSWDQVPRRGGGHWDLDYDHYVKQAKVHSENVAGGKRFWYEGDQTLMPVKLRAMGHDIVDKLNTVRTHLLNNEEDLAKSYAQKHLPIPWDELHGYFKPSRDGKGRFVAPPRLSKTEPFVVVPKDTNIIQMDKELENRYGDRFVDGTRHGSLARQSQVKYTGERDSQEMYTLNNTGTRNEPLYGMEPAKLADPLTTLNRSLGGIINSTFMDDYKVFAVEHWIQEAKPWLDASADELKYSPFWHFNNPVWKKGATVDVKQKFLASKFQIQQLTGTPTTYDTWLHSAAQKLADGIYTTFGPKAIPLDPSWMLDKLKAPDRILRSLAFHAHLGMFNIAQLMVQSQSFATIWGVAGPKMALPGTYGAYLRVLARVNKSPEFLERLDKMASDMHIPGASRWRPGEFKEALAELDRTGFEHVGHEFALRDNPVGFKVVPSAFGNFLDAGTFFFKEAERNNRVGGWMTAYREFRDLSPTGRITNVERGRILSRADLLTANMSRASNSILHTGILSLPTQFFSYQFRMAELMFGKRLTMVERARLLGTYAVLYGVPGAAGLTGLPAGDIWRKQAIQYGYNPGENWYTTTMNEGLPAMLMSLASGNQYNVGDRYGMQGFETIRDLMRGDKTIWDIVGGASYSTGKALWQSADGMFNAMTPWLNGDAQKYVLKIDDIVAPLKELSGPKGMYQLEHALATGEWMSKKGQVLDEDLSKANAIFQYVTGLQSQHIDDAYLKANMEKDQRATDQDTLNQYKQQIQLAIRSIRDHDSDQATDYFKRAAAILIRNGYPQHKYAQALTYATQDKGSLVNQVDWDYYVKNAPDDMKKLFLQTYQTIKQQQGK